MADLTTTKQQFPALDKALEAHPDLSDALACLIEEDMAATLDKYLSGATPEVFATFLSELTRLDWAHIRKHREALKAHGDSSEETVEYEPLKADIDQADYGDDDAETGRKSLENGEWAVTVFAGGAGTRFFTEWPDIDKAMPAPSERMRTNPPSSSDPKGLFPISPVMGWSFIQRIMAEILEMGVKAGKLAPALFMTSRVTHERTAAWLDTDPLWGYPKQAVRLFKQTEIPRLDGEGDLIAKPDGTLFWTGNGHGGIYGALGATADDGKSALEILKDYDVRNIVMGNIDNAVLNPLDPRRLGHHVRKQSKMTLSVVKRSDPNEKVGMTAKRKDSGQVEVIEYSVLDPELSASPDERGGLLFDGAHINTNLLHVNAVRTDLPGTLYTDKPVKVGAKTVGSSTYELLNQHLAGLLEPTDVNVFEGSREGYFLPTKAVTGKDSVESTFTELIRQSATTLIGLGASVEGTHQRPDAYAEWHPCVGLTHEDLELRGVGKGWLLKEGSRLYLGVRHSSGEHTPYNQGLILQEGAALIIDATTPYGTLRYDASSRRLAEDAQTAGKLTMGKHVVVHPGVRVRITIEGNGRLVIPDGMSFDNHLDLTVKPGETITLK